MKNNLLTIASLILVSKAALAERGVNVDVNGFLDSTRNISAMIGNGVVAIAVIILAVGLMLPGFRETTKKSMPWIALGVGLIVLVTKFWR
jgi:tetrahydromethanopterin S-methyltransferase subunit C